MRHVSSRPPGTSVKLLRPPGASQFASPYFVARSPAMLNVQKVRLALRTPPVPRLARNLPSTEPGNSAEHETWMRVWRTIESMQRGALIMRGARLEEGSRTCLAISKALGARADRLRAKSDERVRAFWVLWRRHEASPGSEPPRVAEAQGDAHVDAPPQTR